MTGFFTALMFLTRVPIPRSRAEGAGDLAGAAPWLPVVGAFIGALVAAAVLAGALVDPWVGALLGLLVWVLVTGGLHIDGLGDVADGLGAAHGNPERFVTVARDPHLGSFGAIAIALQIAAKLVLLGVLARNASAETVIAGLMLAAAWARWGALALGRALPPLAEGLASRLALGIETRTVALEAAALAALTLYFAPLLLGALPLIVAFALYWRLRLGGVSGDCLGASIEVLESALLLLLLLA
ncbi:adenosylcobinamide-GDP ribazoletransferase [Hyphomicrobium sp. CS1GBMeth3]|uniref:adenosylcobinamide-GDP ribazoletransferase n=1 Tax=Hyphomicrobium sp. CS1GBMeth3 TaxID=1892845 RepID=UPI0009315B68|nr:adenosylcobinamide-GDP ribazoletransferase [Hyphomicrobium sp. CS1GBMeth3]